LVGTAAGQAIDTLVAKAADLGKALDPVNGNVETIIQSLGLADSATGKYIKRLEEVAGKQAALEEATKQLALVVGDEGVEALRQFGESTKDLGNTISQFITQIAADAAKLLQGPVEATSSIVGAVVTQRAALSSSDPRLASLQQEFRDNTGERTRAEITADLLETYKKITEEAEKETETRLNALSPTNQVLASEERKLSIARLNSDILDDQVLSLEKQGITAQYNIDNQKVLKDLAEEKLTYQEAMNLLKANEIVMERGLLGLTQQRAKQEDNAAKKAQNALKRRLREFKREQERAEKERIRNKVQGLNLDLQLLKVNQDQVTLQTGEVAGINRRLLDLGETKETLKDIARLTSNNAENLQKELKLIDEKLDYEQRILEAKRNQAKVDLEAFVDAALTANKRVVEDAERQTRTVRIQLQNPFDTQAQQSNALLTAQLEERVSLTRRLQDEERKLTDQRAKASSVEDKELAKVLLDNFEKTAEALINELGLRQELERQQLRQNQLIEKYGFLANELSTAMTSAVQAVVTGTGTVEEAFSTMFANIGKAFIDMATKMLAQKLFMTVLSALNPGATGVNPSGAFNIGLAAGRASGGPVSPGSTYLVGERGPELLTMGPSGGYVTSNSASQAAMDRYSSGNARGGSISVNYNVTDINGMRFVTEDQFREGVAQAAKQGADGGFNRTMSSLKNNRSTRSRVGI